MNISEDILKENEREELEKLAYLAEQQNNCINLNLVYMTLKINENNYGAIMNYFAERGIDMIHHFKEKQGYGIKSKKVS